MCFDKVFAITLNNVHDIYGIFFNYLMKKYAIKLYKKRRDIVGLKEFSVDREAMIMVNASAV